MSREYKFVVDDCQFLIRDCLEEQEQEARKRAKQWLEDHKLFNKKLPNLASFRDIEQLPILSTV